MSRVFKREWTGADGKQRASVHYYLDYFSGGKRVIRKTSPATGDRRVALDQLRAAEEGHASPASVNLSAVLDLYEKSRLPVVAKTTATSIRAAAGYWRARLGGRDASSVGKADVAAAIPDLLKDRAPGTARNYITTLKAAIRYAVAEGLIQPHPVTSQPVRLRSPERRTTWTSDDMAAVRAQLVRHVKGKWVGCFDILVATGLRLSDVAGLRVEEVDLERGVIARRQKKTGEEVVVPLSPAGLEAARRAVEAAGAKSGTLWPGLTQRGLQVALRTCMRLAGLEGKTIHDIRRTYAQRMKDAGADDRVIAAALGQRTTSIVSRYASVTLDQIRRYQ